MRFRLPHLLIGFLIGIGTVVTLRVFVLNPYFPSFAASFASMFLSGVVLAVITFQFASLFAERLRCGVCGQSLPYPRKPQNRVQLLKGGWTCPQCGAELDANGTPRQSS